MLFDLDVAPLVAVVEAQHAPLPPKAASSCLGRRVDSPRVRSWRELPNGPSLMRLEIAVSNADLVARGQTGTLFLLIAIVLGALLRSFAPDIKVGGRLFDVDSGSLISEVYVID